MITAKFWARSDVASWHRVGADERRALCGARIGEGFTRSESEMVENGHTSERCERCESAAGREVISEFAPTAARKLAQAPAGTVDESRLAVKCAMTRAAWALVAVSERDGTLEAADAAFLAAIDAFEQFMTRWQDARAGVAPSSASVAA